MGWEQSHPKRTIAISRSDDNRNESPGVTTARITVRPAQRTNQNRRQVQALLLRKNPQENRFGLTDSFRKGPPRRRAFLNGTKAGAVGKGPRRRTAFGRDADRGSRRQGGLDGLSRSGSAGGEGVDRSQAGRAGD